MTHHTPNVPAAAARPLDPLAVNTIAATALHIERAARRLQPPDTTSSSALLDAAEDLAVAASLVRDFVRTEHNYLRDAEAAHAAVVAELGRLGGGAGHRRPFTRVVADILLDRYHTSRYTSRYGGAGSAVTPVSNHLTRRPPGAPPLPPVHGHHQSPPQRAPQRPGIVQMGAAGSAGGRRIPNPLTRVRSSVAGGANVPLHAVKRAPQPVEGHRPAPVVKIPSTVVTAPPATTSVPPRRTGAHRLGADHQVYWERRALAEPPTLPPAPEQRGLPQRVDPLDTRVPLRGHAEA